MTEADRKKSDGWDVALFIYSLAGAFISLSAGVGLLGLALVAWLQSETETALAAESGGVAMLSLALVSLPALIGSGLRLTSGRRWLQFRPGARWLHVGWLFPLGLALGWLAHERGLLTWALGPLAQVLAIGAPAVVLVVLVLRLGPQIPTRRIWGQFLLGVWLIPVTALLIEGILLVGTIFVIGLGLSLTPEGLSTVREIQALMDPSTLTAPPLDHPAVGQLVLNPFVLMPILLMLAVGVPLVEESLKTAAVWPQLRHTFHSSEALLGGALCGAGFALAEGLALTPPSSSWLFTAVVRSGATFMHALAAALGAWGVAEGVRRKRWHRLLLGLGLAVILHGLWNASAVLIGVSQLSIPTGVLDPSTGNTLSAMAIFIILGLSTLAIAGLPALLRRTTDQHSAV